MKTNIKIGDTVKFKDYAEAPEDGPFLKPNSQIIVVEDHGDSYGVIRKEDKPLFDENPEDDTLIIETVFPVELTVPAKRVGIKKSPAKPKATNGKTTNGKTTNGKTTNGKTTAKKKVATKTKAKPTPKAKAEPKVKEKAKPLALATQVKNELKGKSAIDAARKLAKQSKLNDLTLGGILAKVAEDKDYLRIKGEDGKPLYDGKDGFAEFVEEDLGVKYRKARYLINNYLTVMDIGLSFTKASAIGWSKLKEVAPLLKHYHDEGKKEEVDGWVDKSIETAGETLFSEIKETRVKEGIAAKPRGGSTAKHTRFVFSLFNDNAKAVKSAIAKAKKLCGEEASDNDAFFFIINEWVQLNDN